MIEELINFDKNHKSTFDFIIGTDEAGRGPGAGPVFAAAVAFCDYNDELIEELAQLDDSKKLSEKKREFLYEKIKNHAVFSIKQASVEEIDKKNILNASLDTMKAAVCEVLQKLKTDNAKILIDGNKKIKNFDAPMETVVKGDSKSASIAAASVLAKVSRDRFMLELDKQFPQYHWAKNKGYLSAEHIKAIKTCGPSPWHRKKFLRNILAEEKQLTLL